MSAYSTPSPLRPRDLTAGERLRLHRRQEAAQRDRAWVRLEAMRCVHACLPRHQAKRVSRSNPDASEPVRAPPRAAEGDVELALFARLAVEPRAPLGRRPPRRFEAARAAPRRDLPLVSRAGSASPRPRPLRASARRPWRRRPRRRDLVLASRSRGGARTGPRQSRAPVSAAQALRAAPAPREPHIRRAAGFPLGSRGGRRGVLRRRRRHAIEHLADDVLGGDPLHPQLGAQHEAMCERGNGDGLHVVRKHEVATL